ncbi:hypothetical protein R3P38DRAFT_2816040 [Favolaschia claudopus]|uniref:CxC2-like cysteine cluster KDZ transposase-associated domain-containing protein n=1 Tax=Favolaschia claudopus TaxID=2862362 RepID=A0AAV9YZM8_9AGAR
MHLTPSPAIMQPTVMEETDWIASITGKKGRRQGRPSTGCRGPSEIVEVHTASTGPQSVELLVCGHTTQAAEDELPSRVAQLLDAGLFPCSFTEPKSAIAFSVLRRFEILHVESKVPAFDFYGALRRTSDNAFTVDVPDMFDNFIRSSRWWGVLNAQKRAGQAHGIDGFLTHRPKGNTILYCPSCPEPGFNMDNKLLKLPPDLRHLNQQRETIDGNFHCTKSTKNSDPNDYSLYQGSGFSPLTPTSKPISTTTPRERPRSNCNNLNAVNNQDKKKFENTEITGIVNVQCTHVFVKASVDLQHGERYANVDFAFARSIRQRLSAKHKGDVEFTLQFDSVIYFDANDLVVLLLLADLRTAEATFEKHHKHFLGLCATYAQRIVEENWLKESREPDTSDPKFTTSVYRHSNVNVPTQKAIYELMLAQEGVVPNSATSMSKASTTAYFYEQTSTLKIGKLVSRLKVQFTETLKKDIDAQRTKLEESIVAWRRVQRLLLPDIDDFLGSRDACAVEDELLGLPSEVEEPERSALGLTPFVRIEGELREGAAYDAVAKVKVIAKALRALRDRKRKNDSGVYTIAQKQINDTASPYMAAREALMTLGLAVGDETDFQELKPEHTYMKSRSMRRQLGDSRHTEGTIWTQASVSAGMRSTAPSVSVASAATAGPSASAAPTVGTLMGRRKASARPSPTGKSRVKPIAELKKAPPAEGWIWSYKIGKMTLPFEFVQNTQAPISNYAWNNEGDRVQFFRAEAEMERWREQVEMKLAEWRTTVRSFAKYKEIWTKLAAIQDSSDVGFIAYAKDQAAIFGRREAEGGTLLERHQSLSKYRVIEDPNLDLLNFVMERRKQDTAIRDAILQEHSRKSASSEDDDETEEEPSVEETESEEDEFEAEEELADEPSGDEVVEVVHTYLYVYTPADAPERFSRCYLQYPPMLFCFLARSLSLKFVPKYYPTFSYYISTCLAWFAIPCLSRLKPLQIHHGDEDNSSCRRARCDARSPRSSEKHQQQHGKDNAAPGDGPYVTPIPPKRRTPLAQRTSCVDPDSYQPEYDDSEGDVEGIEGLTAQERYWLQVKRDEGVLGARNGDGEEHAGREVWER